MTRTRFLRSCAAIALSAALFGTTAALAQKAGPNGGMIMGKDGHETELVIKPSELTLYLLHDGKPSDAKGAKFRAIIQVSGKNTTLAFTVEGNRLVAKLDAPLAPGAIVVVSGADGHNHAISSRYVVK